MSDTKREFRQTVIPAELAQEIVATMKAHPELGHRTLSDFVRTAAMERLRLIHLQLATRALWKTADLGSDAMDALVRDSLPPDYRIYIETEMRRHRK